jgi:hypothetical protein
MQAARARVIETARQRLDEIQMRRSAHKNESGNLSSVSKLLRQDQQSN